MASELGNYSKKYWKKTKTEIDWKKNCKGLVIPEINTSGPIMYWESYKRGRDRINIWRINDWKFLNLIKIENYVDPELNEPQAETDIKKNYMSTSL